MKLCCLESTNHRTAVYTCSWAALDTLETIVFPSQFLWMMLLSCAPDMGIAWAVPPRNPHWNQCQGSVLRVLPIPDRGYLVGKPHIHENVWLNECRDSLRRETYMHAWHGSDSSPVGLLFKQGSLHPAPMRWFSQIKQHIRIWKLHMCPGDSTESYVVNDLRLFILLCNLK